MSFLRALMCALASGLLISTPAAQEIVPLVEQGNPIPGVGSVNFVRNLIVNDEGVWVVAAQANAPMAVDYSILRFGFPALNEGDPVVEPAGATVRMNGSNGAPRMRMDDQGRFYWALTLTGPPVTGATNQGIYWNTRLIAQKGVPIGAPGFPSEATWTSFSMFDRLGEDRLIVAGAADLTPGIPDLNQTAILEYTLGDFGEVLSTRGVIVRGDGLPAVPGETFLRIHPSNGFRALEANAAGEFIWAAQTEEGSQHILLGTEIVLASTNVPIPSPNPALDGRTFSNFENVEVGLNDFGDYAFTAELNGAGDELLETTNTILFRNGEGYVQEGDAFAGLSGGVIHEFGAGPVYVANSRDLFWVANLRNALSEENRAYMRNREVLIRKGRTTVDDREVTEIPDSPNSFHVSDDGRFWVGQVFLDDASASAWIDLGLVLELPGCTGNEGRLRRVAGSAIVGGSFTLGFSNGPAPGSNTLFAIAPRFAGNPECGVATPFGEYFLGGSIEVLIVGPSWVSGTALRVVDVPNRVELVDSTWFGQGFFFHPNGTSASEPVRLTNGVRLELGAP